MNKLYTELIKQKQEDIQMKIVDIFFRVTQKQAAMQHLMFP